VVLAATDATPNASVTALVIGVGEYDDAVIQPLPGALRDAANVAAALRDPHGIGLAPENVTHLADPTRAELVTTLSTLLARASETIAIYFAGHAFRRDGELFLAPRDAVFEDLPNSAISATQLEDLLAHCEARGVLVVLDCCISAGFAEHASGFFRRLQGADFHILLCASREDERSWELADGRGTLFTKHLLRALRGEAAAGPTPGAITFTGLLDAIDFGVNEDLATLHPNVPRQQPIAAAAFTRDPLLFLQPVARAQGLTLASERVSRTRFRRVLRRAGIGVVIAVAFTLLTLYTWIDHHLYARVNGRVIQVLRGYPDWNLPGYPRVVWEYELEDYLLDPASPLRHGGAIIAALNAPIEPLLQHEMNAVGRATWAFREGKLADARTITLEHLPRDTAPASEQDVLLLHLFAEVATAADLPRLRGLTHHPRPDVRQSAVRAVLRLNQPEGLALLTNDLREGTGLDHGALLDYVEPPCTPDLAAYLSKASLIPTAHIDVPDVALRLGCGVDELALWFLVENRTTAADEVDDLARFASIAGIPALSALAEKQRRIADRPSAVARWSTFAAGLMPPTCPKDAVGVWTDDPKFLWLRMQLLFALAHGCPAAHFDMVVMPTAPRVLLLRTTDPRLEITLDADGVNAAYLRDTLALIKERRLLAAIPFARAIAMHHDESIVRAWAVDTLRALDERVAISNDMLYSTDVSLRRAAYLAWAEQDHDRAVGALLSRIEDEGFDDFEETICRLNVPRRLQGKLVEALHGTDRASARAAAALACHGDAVTVLRLFRTPSRIVRRSAESFVSANPELGTALRTAAKPPHYPRESISSLWNALTRRNELAAELARCPPWARSWHAHDVVKRRRSLVARLRALTTGEAIWLEKTY